MRTRKDPSKRLLKLGTPSSTYGGIFDLVNTDPNLEAAQDLLKFMAVFYDAIIVPDAFLMSYTPLFRHIQALTSKGADSDDDLLSVFLRNGIIVPALRRGDSLVDNWRTGPFVFPGTEMRVERAVGRAVLEFVDRRTTRYTKIHLDSTTNRFYDLVNRFVIGAERPAHTALTKLGSSQSPELDCLFNQFEALAGESMGTKKLRRLDIELLISDNVARKLKLPTRDGFLPNLYPIVGTALAKSPRDPLLSGCQFLLNATSTIYQAYHAFQFDVLGGLFPAHDRRLIDAGLYQYLAGLPDRVLAPSSTRVRRSPVLLGSLNMAALSPNQIVTIRKRPEFGEYLAELAKWKPVRPGKTAIQENPAFVEHLRSKYLPFLMRNYPDAAWIAPTIKGVGSTISVAASLLTIFHGPTASGVLVGNHSVVTQITAIAAGVAAGYSRELASPLQSARKHVPGRRFLNQYTAKMP